MAKKSYNAIPASKADIREFVLKKRNFISARQRRQKSSAIDKKLFSMPAFRKAKTVFTYISFRSEVSTRGIIKKCLSLGKKVAVPVADMKLGKIIPVQFESFSSLKKSRFGVPEPALENSIKIPASKIDFIVVPGVAFDTSRNRIGYGKGFYDRFLSRHGKIPNAAIAFEAQLLSSVPAGSADMKVRKIITENRII